MENKYMVPKYWMNCKADMFSIKSDLKEVSKKRKKLGAATMDHIFSFLFTLLTLHGPMMLFQILAVFYSVLRIFACKIKAFQERPDDSSIGDVINHLSFVNCFFLSHFQLVYVQVIALAFTIWHFLPTIIGQMKARNNNKQISHKRKKEKQRKLLPPITLHALYSSTLMKEQSK